MPDDPVQLAFGWSAGEDQGRFPRNPRPALPVPFRNGVRMGYSLGQAARAAGRSKTTIHRTIKSGRLSAARTADGYEIDPAELERVFRTVTGDGDVPVERTVTDLDPVALTVEVTALRSLAEGRAETIRDLRARLDAAEARLDRLLLTDQRPPAPARRSWWRWR